MRAQRASERWSSPAGRVGLALLLLATIACGADPAPASPSTPRLTPVGRFPLDKAISDPSGLSIAGDVLYVVSDAKEKVFAVTRYGVLVNTVELAGGAGFEAIAVAGDALLIAREPTGELLRVSAATGALLDRVAVANVVDGNSGLEGLAVRPDGHILAAKEKSPSLLVHLAPDGTEVSRITLDFAPDVSGLASLGDAACPDQLLAVSQEGRALYQINEAGRVLAEWTLDADRPEGVAYDGRSLYLVDEAPDELLVFDFPGGCR